MYHCAIDKELFAAKIEEAQTFARDRADQWIVIDVGAIGDEDEMFALKAIGFLLHPTRPDRLRAHPDQHVLDHLKAHKIKYERERFESATAMGDPAQGLKPSTAGTSTTGTPSTTRSGRASWKACPCSSACSTCRAWPVCSARPRPRRGSANDPADQEPTDTHGTDTTPLAAIALSGDLPPLDQLIESGKVLALNMPAGTNPALARAIGVMLKNAWLQSLLRRPATMKREPGRYVRPAVFIHDEYQAFASVGEDDPSGDEKAFALTRQCRVIPIVATQSISSLRSVLGSSEAWRTLLQTLRTRIFLSLSDEASAEIASKLCGQVAKIKSSYTITESAEIERHQFAVPPKPAGAGPASAPARVSRSSARRCFNRATSPCSGTVRRSVSPATACSRSRQGGYTSSRTTSPPRSRTGKRNEPDSFERGGCPGTPEPVSPRPRDGAPGAPGHGRARFPEADPVAVLVRYHTPNVYTAVVAWYDVAPGVVAYFAGQFLLSTSRIWFARMGVRLGLAR